LAGGSTFTSLRRSPTVSGYDGWDGASAGGPTAAFDGAAQLVISDPALMLDAALLHMGIAHIGRHHAHEALARGSLVEVLASEHVGSDARMSLFYPHRAGLAPRVRVLVDHLMQHFAQEPALQVVPRKR
jgi:DNA-binding transcriptional LysR family regulator